MKSITRLLFATWILLAVGLPSTAHAGDPLAKPADAAARERLTAGNRLYRVREFEKAIEEYKAGALREDAPVFLYNLGQCYRQLGQYEDAIWHYERFLERGMPEGQIKGAVDDFIAQMKAELQKKAMTQPPVEPAPEVTPSGPPIVPATSTPKTVTIITPGEAWYRDPVGWGFAGAGVIGAGVSGWLLFSAGGLDDDANAEPRQDVRDRLHERASGRRLAGTLVGIAGAGLLVTGIVKLALRPNDREHTVTTSWNLGVTRDGFAVFGMF